MRLSIAVGLGVVTALAVLPLESAQAQVLVLPRRADKAQVRRFSFDWRFIDVDAKPLPPPGGLKKPPTAGPGSEAEGGTGAPVGAPPPGEGPAATTPGSPTGGESGGTPPSPPQPAGPGGDEGGRDGGTPSASPPAQSQSGAGGAASTADLPSAAAPGSAESAAGDPSAASPSTAQNQSGPGGTLPPVVGGTSGLPGRGSGGETVGKAGEQGGLRLYYYEREQHIAELAIPLILDAYDYLRVQFGYTPSQRFPYILYNTYQEFLETRLFPVQEGVLGVTSPIDLSLTLPYFGDHRRFTEVSTHEMAHQFTIQKLRDLAKRDDTDSPINKLPLWFVEGLAEFYAQHGIDPETEMLARDIVVNPDARRGYALLDFFEDHPGSVLWTYKVGQARVAFLEDEFGAGITQRILERSIVMSMGGGRFSLDRGRLDFPLLLQRVTGENKEVLAQHFADWLKRRAYRTYLDAKQPAASLIPLDPELGKSPILGMASSPDGDVLMYRRIDMNTGQTQLVVADRRDPRHGRKVAGDGTPGAESLHPVSPRNFDIGNNAIVYTAQVDSRDVIYWQELERKAESHQPRRRRARTAPYWSGVAARVDADRQAALDRGEDVLWDVQLSLGDRIEYRLDGIISVESPALSPDGSRIAFIGTGPDGFRDIYVLEPKGASYEVRRLTHDLWAERQLSWGKDGIVYTSDATEARKFNLFRIDPERPDVAPVRLTYEERDEFDPLCTADGRIYFVAYQDARADVHEVVDGRVLRRTDVATGITDVSAGPEGGLWGLWLHSGIRMPVRIAREDLMDLASTEGRVANGPEPLAEHPLGSSKLYSPLSLDNWRMGPIFGLLGAGAGSIFGQVYASATDMMRDHVMVLNLNIWGSWELTDGLLLYINQEKKVGWGTGVFQSLNYHLDRTLEDVGGGVFTSYERFFGAMGMLRYPFDTFRYAELSLAAGGTRYFLIPGQDYLLDFEGFLDIWNQRNDKTWFQLESSLGLGLDTVRYHPLTGPIDGTSVLAQVTATAQPERGAVFGEARLDAARYFALGGSSKIFIRGGIGTSYGGKYAREFYLSSFDTLRGVRFGTDYYLLGEHFYFTTLQLNIPLNAIVRVVFLPNIEGVAGLDFGGTANAVSELWDKRVFDGVLGFNLVFGPLVFRVHFAKPIDTGATPPAIDAYTPAPALGRGWVTNLSLGWLNY